MVERRPNNPDLIVLLGRTLFEGIANAPPSARMNTLLEAREQRMAKIDAAAHARAAKARQAEEADAVAASNEHFANVGRQRRRWNRSES